MSNSIQLIQRNGRRNPTFAKLLRIIFSVPSRIASDGVIHQLINVVSRCARYCATDSPDWQTSQHRFDGILDPTRMRDWMDLHPGDLEDESRRLNIQS